MFSRTNLKTGGPYMYCHLSATIISLNNFHVIHYFYKYLLIITILSKNLNKHLYIYVYSVYYNVKTFESLLINIKINDRITHERKYYRFLEILYWGRSGRVV